MSLSGKELGLLFTLKITSKLTWLEESLQDRVLSFGRTMTQSSLLIVKPEGGEISRCNSHLERYNTPQPISKGTNCSRHTCWNRSLYLEKGNSRL